MTNRMITYAKDLRIRSTDAERLLWRHLRAKRLGGFKFRRQHPIGNYIVDFICLERKLIIELDGGQHTMPEIEAYDKERDDWLDEEGYRILRFWDDDVLQNINGILEIMERTLSGTPSPSSPPLQGGAMSNEW